MKRRLDAVVGCVALACLASGPPPREARADSPRAPAPAPTTLAPGEAMAGRTTITLPDTSAYSPAERQILALERERSAAIARRDTTWLARLYAADFLGVAANGRRIDRSDLFRIFGRDDPTSTFRIDELAVRGHGAAATVTGRLRFFDAGGEAVGESRYLHVYIVRGGRWWIVAAQGTAVAPPQPAKP